MCQPKELNTLKGKLNAVKRSKKSRHFCTLALVLAHFLNSAGPLVILP